MQLEELLILLQIAFKSMSTSEEQILAFLVVWYQGVQWIAKRFVVRPMAVFGLLGR